MSERQPTIANPFALPERQFVPAKRPTSQYPNPVVAPVKKMPPVERKYEDAGFFISQSTVRLLDAAIASEEISKDDLPFIYKTSKTVCQLFRRPSPTISDIEIAVKLKSADQLEKVASGEVQFDILRRDTTTMEVIPKAKRIQFWQTVAQKVLEGDGTVT